MDVTQQYLPIERLTAGAATGDGVFEKLMRSGSEHIDTQYSKNRISKTDFASTYVSMFQTTLQQATAWGLGEIEVNLRSQETAAKIELLKAQTDKVRQDIDLDVQRFDLEERRINAEILRIEAERQNILATITLTEAKTLTENARRQPEIDKLIAEKDILILQGQLEQALLQPKIDKMNAEILHLSKQNQVLDKEILIKQSQRDKLVQDINFALDKHPIELDKMNKEVSLLQSEISKTNEELLVLTANRLLTDAKRVTENDRRQPEIDKLVAEKDIALIQVQLDQALLQPKIDRMAAEVAKITKENEVLDEEILVKRKQVEKLTQDIIIDLARHNVEVSQINKRIEVMTAEIEKIGDELLVMESNRLLTDERRLTESARRQPEIDRLIAEKDIAVIKAQLEQALLNPRIQKISAEITHLNKQNDLIDQEILKMIADVDLAEKQIEIAQAEINIKQQQLQKMFKEIALMEAKIWTEQAQVLDVVNGNPVVGVIGKEKALLTEQTKAFKWDAEHNLLKTAIQSYVTRFSVSDGETAVADAAVANLADVDISKLIIKAASSLNIVL